MKLANRLAYYAKRLPGLCQSFPLAFGTNRVCQSYAIVKPLHGKNLEPFDIYKNNIYIPFIRFLSYLNTNFAGLSYFNKYFIKKRVYIKGAYAIRPNAPLDHSAQTR
jgi:hypothetical protein